MSVGVKLVDHAAVVLEVMSEICQLKWRASEYLVKHFFFLKEKNIQTFNNILANHFCCRYITVQAAKGKHNHVNMLAKQGTGGTGKVKPEGIVSL